jgi:hypothetical protein
MTIRNSSRPIARVFRATAAPGCRDELLQRFHSSSAALVNSKVGCLKYRIRWLNTLEAHVDQIERADKHIDHPNRIALVNEIIEAFGQ